MDGILAHAMILACTRCQLRLPPTFNHDVWGLISGSIRAIKPQLSTPSPPKGSFWGEQRFMGSVGNFSSFTHMED